MPGTVADQEILEETRRLLPNDSSLVEHLPAVYHELRGLAASFLRGERIEHTLQPTALVHEAYLRLREQRRVDWSNRAQFFAIAARIMRRVLVKHALRRKREKRGAGQANLALDSAVDVFDQEAIPVLALHRALADLETLDPRQAQIVELRFFAGLNVEETAATLGISPATVKREWAVTRLWLAREMA